MSDFANHRNSLFEIRWARQSLALSGFKPEHQVWSGYEVWLFCLVRHSCPGRGALFPLDHPKELVGA